VKTMGIDFLVYVSDRVEVSDGSGVETLAYQHYLYEVNNLDEYDALKRILDPKYLFSPVRTSSERTKHGFHGYLNLVLVDIQDMKTADWITIPMKGRKLPCLVEDCIWNWFDSVITVDRTIKIVEPCNQIVVYVDKIEMSDVAIVFDYELSEYETYGEDDICIEKIIPQYEVYFKGPQPHAWIRDVLTPLLRFLEKHYPLITKL